MSTTKTALLCVPTATACLVAAAPAYAQRSQRPATGACFYKDPDFEGEFFCVRVGEGFGSMPKGMNDKISSIQIIGRAEVVVFQDVKFDGGDTRLDYSVPNLKVEGWNDRISSLRVQQAVERPRGRGRDDRPEQAPRRR